MIGMKVSKAKREMSLSGPPVPESVPRGVRGASLKFFWDFTYSEIDSEKKSICDLYRSIY